MADLLLVEDSRDLARGLIANLEFEGHVVTHCERGDEVLPLFKNHEFDLIILDVMLPGADGMSVLQALRKRQVECPILMLTARGEELDKVHALRKGADDYVTKPFGLMELLARVEALLRRSSSGSSDTSDQKIGPWLLKRASRQVLMDGEDIALAPKEYDLFLALADHPGQVQSRHDLLSRVWGHNEEVATRTVDTHMAELRKKLEADPANPDYLLTARSAGYWLKQ